MELEKELRKLHLEKLRRLSKRRTHHYKYRTKIIRQLEDEEYCSIAAMNLY